MGDSRAWSYCAESLATTPELLRCVARFYEPAGPCLSKKRLHLVMWRRYTVSVSSIRLVYVTKQWATAKALDDVSLEIDEGSFCVLLGPSGCGKSTTLRVIAGLESASGGQVIVNGRDVTALPPSQRGLAMVFQNYALFPHLKVADNIGFGLSVRKVPKAESARRLQGHELRELQLPHDSSARRR